MKVTFLYECTDQLGKILAEANNRSIDIDKAIKNYDFRMVAHHSKDLIDCAHILRAWARALYETEEL